MIGYSYSGTGVARLFAASVMFNCEEEFVKAFVHHILHVTMIDGHRVNVGRGGGPTPLLILS